MRLKEAILAKGEKAHYFPSTFLGIDFRGRIENYYEAYSLEQLSYLFKHGFLRKYEKNGVKCGEQYYADKYSLVIRLS